MTAKTYKLTAEIAEITEWNNDSEDWTGAQTAKFLYRDAKLIITDKLTRLQLRDAITETLYLDDDFLTEAELFIYSDIVRVSITENAEGLPDPNGNFLVDYNFTVTEVKAVNLQEVL